MQKQDRRSLKMFYVLDSNGEPRKADVFEWAEFLEDDNRRVVASDRIGANVRVSTVFLGIDHNFFGRGAPLLWETMVFGGRKGGDLWRFSSQAEAIQFHYALVADLRTKGRGVQ